MAFRTIALAEFLGEAALEADGGKRRHQLHDHRGIGEAPERLRAVELAGDEQERQARQQPEHEPEEVRASALRERRGIRVARPVFRLFGQTRRTGWFVLMAPL